MLLVHVELFKIYYLLGTSIDIVSVTNIKYVLLLVNINITHYTKNIF